ncbi:MAG: cysteine synthase A [Deltaproteobacteria bacterium]|nr:cysteine synthase A [Deltaproteobacteria bacterium]
MNHTDIMELIGSTPLIRLSKMGGGRVFTKAEFLNPGGSVKDRVALHMIKDAEESGALKPGGTIIEATSGNTGIGLAFVGVRRGYRVILVMPGNMSEERKKVIAAFGGECVLTPADESLEGALKKVYQLKDEIEGSWIPQQFENPANPECHYRTTGPEIWEQTGGKVDSLVAGVGSGGTLAGVGRFLKEKNPDVRVVAVEPKNVSALLGHEPGLHQIQGIGDGFIPTVLDVKIINHVIEVTDEEAVSVTRQLALEEGLLVGTSAGANVFAALREAAFLGPESSVVTILPDRAERYFSTALL